MSTKPNGALIVGSVPLSSSDEVFRMIGETLGDRLRRIPDGETGPRIAWIGWQGDLFRDHALFEPAPPPPGEYSGALGRYRLKDRSLDRSTAIDFPELGYVRDAKASYEIFKRLRDAGTIYPGTRFQVSLPTPVAVVSQFVELEDRTFVEPFYESAMINEAIGLTEAIPHEDLAIQWDVAVEISILEGAGEMFTAWWDDPKDAVLERLIRLGDTIPEDVELGYHLCYGDYEHKHVVEPENLGLCVSLANRLAAGVHRSIEWFHMPVPRSRGDDAYFAPLGDLKIAPETELFIGLVHLTDGVEGTEARIAAAQRAVADFGVATECGFGRRPAESVQPLLDIHHAVAAPVAV
jgi:hypothetical protein